MVCHTVHCVSRFPDTLVDLFGISQGIHSNLGSVQNTWSFPTIGGFCFAFCLVMKDALVCLILCFFNIRFTEVSMLGQMSKALCATSSPPTHLLAKKITGKWLIQ